MFACMYSIHMHVWAVLFGSAPVQKSAKSLGVAVNPFCRRLIALIALALYSGFSRKGTSVTSWVIHLHSSSPLFFPQDTSGGRGMSYLPQTTLQGQGLDDISWNKAAENTEHRRVCWWGCKWAMPVTESRLQNTKFQNVSSVKNEVANSGHISISCSFSNWIKHGL